jgi:DNA-binding GntR family transcriptional regulator
LTNTKNLAIIKAEQIVIQHAKKVIHLADTGSSPITHENISDSVYNWIKQAILNVEFKPGERLPQEAITERLNISRTPVREAFKRLEAEGLLAVKPHLGAVVVHLSRSKFLELYEIRELLETAAALHAAENISDSGIAELEKINAKMIALHGHPQKFMDCNRTFHLTLYGFSNRDYLVNYITGIWNLTEPYRLMYISHEGKTSVAVDEHVQILTALKQKKARDVSKAIHDHLHDVVTTLSSNSTDLLDVDSPA